MKESHHLQRPKRASLNETARATLVDLGIDWSVISRRCNPSSLGAGDMTVDELIAEVNKRGLRLNNLFQLHDQRWQANITDGEMFWKFGRGDTAIEALQAALQISATTSPNLGYKAPEPAKPPPGQPFKLTL
jgi:hypothetical protein